MSFRASSLEPLYEAPSGPVSPIDIIYGYRGKLATGKFHMAHKCGFTYSVLAGCFVTANVGR